MLTTPDHLPSAPVQTSVGSDIDDYGDFPTVDGPGPDAEKILDLLDQNAGGGMLEVIRSYWGELVDQANSSPIMRTYLAGLYSMANEYRRIDTSVEFAREQLEVLGTSPQLSNERSRLRDNISAMTLEGWRLQNALLDALNKFQSTISRLSKSTPTDPFDEFMEGSAD